MVASRLETPHELSVDEEIGANAPELIEDQSDSVKDNAAVSEVAADSRVLGAPVDDEDFELVVVGDCKSNLIINEKVQDSQQAQGYVLNQLVE